MPPIFSSLNIPKSGAHNNIGTSSSSWLSSLSYKQYTLNWQRRIPKWSSFGKFVVRIDHGEPFFVKSSVCKQFSSNVGIFSKLEQPATEVLALIKKILNVRFQLSSPNILRRPSIKCVPRLSLYRLDTYFCCPCFLHTYCSRPSHSSPYVLEFVRNLFNQAVIYCLHHMVSVQISKHFRNISQISA